MRGNKVGKNHKRRRWQLEIIATYLNFIPICPIQDFTRFSTSQKSLLSQTSCFFLLENDSSLAIEWFQNNYMKLNEGKCHLLDSGIKHEVIWDNVGDRSHMGQCRGQKSYGPM